MHSCKPSRQGGFLDYWVDGFEFKKFKGNLKEGIWDLSP
jgi:hypothetical protein